MQDNKLTEFIPNQITNLYNLCRKMTPKSWRSKNETQLQANQSRQNRKSMDEHWPELRCEDEDEDSEGGAQWTQNPRWTKGYSRVLEARERSAYCSQYPFRWEIVLRHNLSFSILLQIYVLITFIYGNFSKTTH